MEFISDRVSVEKRADGLSIVVSPRLTQVKQTLLVTWFIAWTLCGLYFMYALTQPQEDPQTHKGLLVMLAMWALFEFRIGRVLLWRLRGFEIWRVKEGVFTIKDSILGYGKAHDHFIENIQRFGPIEVDESSWKWQVNDSFWVRGAERLGFEHLGRKVAFGKGLTKEEAARASQLIARALKQYRKNAQ